MSDFTGLLIGREDVDGFREGFADRGCSAEDLRVSLTLTNPGGSSKLTFAFPPIPKTPTKTFSLGFASKYCLISSVIWKSASSHVKGDSPSFDQQQSWPL